MPGLLLLQSLIYQKGTQGKANIRIHSGRRCAALELYVMHLRICYFAPKGGISWMQRAAHQDDLFN